ncbi:hypothetical protein G6Z90_18105 [Vibrio aestuarianus subsp. cardii]|uniref:hypothetical protein n=1 Tax=Vibrio aestuarianus TaxID=28171 RepID=UPI00159388C0|nr:hypothetical protein [Vibrio aestuarianus]MDE1310368.1 hypothetical protein [Vibrio aestuarianus]NGZ94355.1 hypothetical protein [Vibrio aestuarianus subsp. cardii]
MNKFINEALSKNNNMIVLTEEELKQVSGAGSINAGGGCSHDKTSSGNHDKSHDKCTGGVSW